MKKIMIIVAFLATVSQIYAQGSKSSRASADTNEIHTIFHKGSGVCMIPLGYFIEINGGFSHFGHSQVFLPGMSMGIILNHHWTIGMTGSMISNQHGSYHHSDNDSVNTGRHGSSSHGGYGGVLLEYTLFPQSKVHVSFPLIVGGGVLFRDTPPDSLNTQSQWSQHNFSHGEHFFVLEPGVKLELNVIKKLRIGLGVSYRYSPEHDRRITSPELMNQLTAKLSLRFGKF